MRIKKKDKKKCWFLVAPPKLIKQMWYWDKDGNLVIPKEYIDVKKLVGSKNTK